MRVGARNDDGADGGGGRDDDDDDDDDERRTGALCVLPPITNDKTGRPMAEYRADDSTCPRPNASSGRTMSVYAALRRFGESVV